MALQFAERQKITAGVLICRRLLVEVFRVDYWRATSRDPLLLAACQISTCGTQGRGNQDRRAV